MATIQQYLCAGLVDEMHIVITPLLVGAVNDSSTTSKASTSASNASSW